MKTSLQLKMGQQLAMTPQLQQAIRLLQLSTLDLQQEIQQVLESNPMLELEQEYEDDFSDSQDPETDLSTLELQHDNAELDERWSKQELPEDLPVDSQWEDTYQSNAGISSNNTNQFDGDFDSDLHHATTENLQDHLLWQLNRSEEHTSELQSRPHLVCRLLLEKKNKKKKNIKKPQQ